MIESEKKIEVCDSPALRASKKAALIAAIVSGSVAAILSSCGGNTESDRAGVQSGDTQDASTDSTEDTSVPDANEPDVMEPDASVPDASVPDAEPDADTPPQIEYGSISIENYSEPVSNEFDADTQQARIAYFTLSPDNVEAVDVSQINVAFEGDCAPDELSNFQLFMANNDSEIFGDFSINEETGELELQFSPVYMDRGASRSFYVSANIGCCNGDLRTYIADESDVVATGTSYGMPITINNNYDGNSSTVNGYFGIYKLPNDTRADIGSTDVNCLGIRTRNCLSEGITMSDFTFTVEIANPTDFNDPQDLIDTSVSPAEANFSDIKLVTGYTNLGDGMTVMGPMSISTNSSDVAQTFPLNSAFTIFTNEERDYRVSIDVRDNQAIIGNQLECIMDIPDRYNFTYDSTGEPIEEDRLYIEPAGFRGVTLTMTGEKDGCLNIVHAAQPVSSSYYQGDQGIDFACFVLSNGCGQNVNLSTFRLYRHGLGITTDFSEFLSLFQGTTQLAVSTFNIANSSIYFNGIDLDIPDGVSSTVCVQGGFSLNAGTGNQNGLEITSPQDVVFQSAVEIGGDFPIQGPVFNVVGN
ncbi:hypothetical protein ACFL2V_03370 [Pseudomonadota bacterium]